MKAALSVLGLLTAFIVGVIVWRAYVPLDQSDQAARAKACGEFLSTLDRAGIQRDLTKARVLVDSRFESADFAEQEKMALAVACDEPSGFEYDILDAHNGRRIAHWDGRKLTRD